jgi:amino acid adenylation domain-containing protein
MEHSSSVSGLLQDCVADQAERRPDATAIVLDGDRLTYGELESGSSRLAVMLLQIGCRRGDRVCLFAEKAPATIMAMLGVLKAGAMYVPIDLASPAVRVARIVRSADPAAVLILGEPGIRMYSAVTAEDVFQPTLRVGALDDAARVGLSVAPHFTAADLDGLNGRAPALAPSPADAAHLLFTSGSTGEPKGVVITHANVTAFLDWAVPYFDMRPGQRISGHPPLHFDLSTFDIYGSLRVGAELHLVSPSLLLPRQLADFIVRSELTQWFAVPSAFTYMARHGGLPEQGFPQLERVLWCGEVLPVRVLIDWMRAVPKARFTNLYGPTEATIASSYFTLPSEPSEDLEAIPIGQACAGEELLVLDEQLARVPEGETGQLYIGGAGLSPGYWRDPERSDHAFPPDPRTGHAGERLYRTGDLAQLGSDGELYFKGRVDHQIKSRGYRIELGEIEAALYALGSVAECVAVGIPTDGFEGMAIGCAYTVAGGVTLEPAHVRSTLRDRLPPYMLPSRLVRMDTLPKNANGKADRRQVQALFLKGRPTELAGR